MSQKISFDRAMRPREIQIAPCAEKPRGIPKPREPRDRQIYKTKDAAPKDTQ